MADFDVEDTPRKEKAKPQVKEDSPDLFSAMLEGKAITKTIETERGVFKIRYPTGKDRVRIDQLKAVRRNGLPASAFDVSALYNNEVFSTLDVAVIDGPDWWKEARSKNNQWSWEECPDEELVIELYRQVDSFRTNVQERIRQSRSAGSIEIDKPTGVSTPVGDGAFSGIANGSTP